MPTLSGESGTLKSNAADVENGMDGKWTGEGELVFDRGGQGLAGRGWAQRDMAATVDFYTDAEWFFSVQISRSGAKPGGSDFASVVLFNNDKSVTERPLQLGISSQDAFMVKLGEAEQVVFGKAQDNVVYTLAARLRLSVDQPDRLEVWVWPSDQKPPASGPGKPDAKTQANYDGNSNTLRFQTGNEAAVTSRFSGFRWAATWRDLFDPSPEVIARDLPYREFTHLRVVDNGTQRMPIHWSSVSLFPTGKGRAPDVLVSSTHAWIPARSMLYQPADEATRAAAEPTPNPDLPLYATGQLEHNLPHGRYQSVRRPDGSFAVIDVNHLIHHADIDPSGVLTWKSQPIELELPGGRDSASRKKALDQMTGNTEVFFGDVDGDDVPDLLMARPFNPYEKWTYWPHKAAPWKLESMPHIGPHTDVTATDGFRGYGVDGDWLGAQVTFGLFWSRGETRGDGWALGPEQPVFMGSDDFQVQWRNPGQRMAPALIDRQGQRYVVLFSDVDESFAMPIRHDAPQGTLMCGASHALLSADADLSDFVLPRVIGVQDITGDGQDEIVIGSGSNGRPIVIGGDRIGEMKSLGSLETVGGFVAVETLGVPDLGDWNGDGHDDLIIGDGTGYYTFWPGTDDPTVFEGSRRLADDSGTVRVFKGIRNLQGSQERGWGYTQAQLFDWDGDGQVDLIGNDNTSTFNLLQRIDPADPTRTSVQPFIHDGHKLGVAWRHRPAVLSGEHKLAGDDRPVLIYLDLHMNMVAGIPTRTGSTEIERIVPITYTDGKNVRTSGSAGLSGRTVINAADWDGDGLWDLVIGGVYRNIVVYNPDPIDQALTENLRSSSAFWMRNVGTNAEPKFERARRITWADGAVTRVETHGFAIQTTDLNNDGKLDLIFGDGPGFIYRLMRDELAWE